MACISGARGGLVALVWLALALLAAGAALLQREPPPAVGKPVDVVLPPVPEVSLPRSDAVNALLADGGHWERMWWRGPPPRQVLPSGADVIARNWVCDASTTLRDAWRYPAAATAAVLQSGPAGRPTGTALVEKLNALGARSLLFVGDSLTYQVVLALFGRLCGAPKGSLDCPAVVETFDRVNAFTVVGARGEPVLEVGYVRAPTYETGEEMLELHPSWAVLPDAVAALSDSQVQWVFIGVSHHLTRRKLTWVPDDYALDALSVEYMRLAARYVAPLGARVAWLSGSRYVGRPASEEDLNHVVRRNAQARAVALEEGHEFVDFRPMLEAAPAGSHVADGRPRSHSKDWLHWCVPGVPDDEVDYLVNFMGLIHPAGRSENPGI